MAPSVAAPATEGEAPPPSSDPASAEVAASEAGEGDANSSLIKPTEAAAEESKPDAEAKPEPLPDDSTQLGAPSSDHGRKAREQISTEPMIASGSRFRRSRLHDQ